MKASLILRIFGLSAALTFAGVASAQIQIVTGAGGSFPKPVYLRWAADYAKISNVQVNYQSVGSGAGIKQIEAKSVDFGATDIPLSNEDLNTFGLVQFPTVIGGIVPVINIPDIKPDQLKLNGTVLADIYLGKITKWDDKAIADLNPGTKLPDDLIVVVRRADPSGTSFGFTSYLSAVSPEWKETVGADKAPNWPTGLGGKGNEGIAAFVSRVPSSIGYVEYAYAKQTNLVYVQLQNANGKFVRPNIETFKAAASGADWTKSLFPSLINQPGDNVWPIASTTFILLYAKQDNHEQGEAVKKFFEWAYKNGDKAAEELDYVSLPDSVKNKVAKVLDTIK